MTGAANEFFAEVQAAHAKRYFTAFFVLGLCVLVGGAVVAQFIQPFPDAIFMAVCSIGLIVFISVPIWRLQRMRAPIVIVRLASAYYHSDIFPVDDATEASGGHGERSGQSERAGRRPCE